MKAIIVSCLALAVGVRAASAQVVISEIHYHPVEEPVFNADGTPFLDLTNDVHEFVEIQNAGAGTVDLSGWTLAGGISYTFPTNTTVTDDPLKPAQFAFASDATIAACGYLLVWCDTDTAAPGLHTGFGLDAAGETVLLLKRGVLYLSDDLISRQKFQIPAGTSVSAGSYKTFYAADFATGAVPFGFDAKGDEVVLSAVDGAGALTGYGSLVRFGAGAESTSFTERACHCKKPASLEIRHPGAPRANARLF